MSTRTDRRATRAARWLASDRRLRAAFRRDPAAAMHRWRLRDDQLAALRAGDARSLAAVGVDVSRVHTPPMSRRVRARLALVLAGVTTLLLGPASAPATAGRASIRVRARRFGSRFVSERAVRISDRFAKDGSPRYAIRFHEGVVLRARLLGVPDGCKQPGVCGVFEVVE